MISDDDIQRVREASDLVAIVQERSPMRQRGREFWCCCPFHNEKTPSFKVDPASQTWHCFGCGEGGDVFGYVMRSEDMGFVDAVRYLADKAHVDIADTNGPRISQSRKQRLRDVCEATAKFYHDQLMRGSSDGAARARAYLAGRGFGGQVPKVWNLGYAPGKGTLMSHLQNLGFKIDEMVEANVVSRNSSGRFYDRFFDRVMFPISDAQGSVIAFGGRVMGDGNPKYLNSQETPLFHKSNVLYGLDKAKAAMTASGSAVVVEGYTDVIALHKAGIQNVVATLGTALTMQHIRLLSRHAGNRIVYLFDGDSAGQRAADRALQFIDDTMTPEAGRTRIEICAVTLPDDLDPAEFVEAKGSDELKTLIDNAKPLLQYGIERRLEAHDLGTAEGRTRALNEALSVLAPIKDSLLAKDYAAQIADKVRMREDDVLARLAALKPPKRYEESANGAQPKGAQDRIELTSDERNRLKIERQFLGLSAQNPLEAVAHADVLAKTLWHDRVHSDIASALLAAMSENLNASPAQVISKTSESVPQAASVLTAATLPEGASVEKQIEMLSNQLQIGDTEEAISSLKSKLANQTSPEKQESDVMFQNLVELQKRVTELRKTLHRS